MIDVAALAARGKGEPAEDGARTPEELARLTSPEVNYMELEEKAGAFSCGTCSWAGEGGHCTNPKVDADVSPDHGCCNLFDPAGGPPTFPPDWEAP